MKRKDELLKQIGELNGRIAHLIAQAHKVEKGTDEWSAKTRDGQEAERTDTHKINHSEAVSYWREVRENEGRRDALAAELRALDAGGVGEPVSIAIQCDGPAECSGEAPGMSRN